MKKLLVTIFGLGYLPFAPGTWGSLPPAFFFAVIIYGGAPPGLTSAFMAVLAVIGSVICLKLSPYIILAAGKTDPKEMVADEFAGQALTFFAMCLINPHLTAKGPPWAIAAMGLILFRLFDVLKPWPIKKFEKLPAGWGILTDDLAAAIFAGILFFFINLAGSRIAQYSGSADLSLNLVEAALLGLVQGLTEFLPVSSSGHLVLFENLFGLKAESTEMLIFDLTVHLGTVIAIFIVFRKTIVKFLQNLSGLGKFVHNPLIVYQKDAIFHILILALAATAMTGPIGIIFKKFFTSARGSLGLVAVMWLITGVLLLAADMRKKAKIGLRQFGLVMALIIGLAQAVAILPGISRSGATICTAILLGLRRRWAVEFSFLLAVFAILGANAVELAGELGNIDFAAVPIASIITGLLAAVISGAAAIKILTIIARRGKLRIFAFYCFLLGLFVLIYCLK